MSALSRRRALALAASALTVAAGPLAGCGRSNAIAVGSKNFTEELILGRLYAQALAGRGLTIRTRLDLGGTEVAMEALVRGDIDLYPEYTGTALFAILKRTPSGDPARDLATIRRLYRERWDLIWLEPAPLNDSQALATTQALAARDDLHTLSQLARAAPQLRLGAIPEFTSRPDGLPGLQRAYGGFHFKSVRLFDIGLKYQALLQGDVDVVVAFTTDGQIVADHLVVLDDDKNFWPQYHVAPVVRAATLRRYPAVAPALDTLAPLLTTATMRGLNQAVDGGGRDPAAVAAAFLAAHRFT
ncbi:MAG: glycine betaine ABC transporter substrate-binding protein [Vulcanimicrobiaceae bacterium]